MAYPVLLAILILISTNYCVNSQENGCPCNDPSSGAIWGSIIRMGECVGKCDLAARNDTWDCVTPENRTLNCSRKTQCSLHRTCEGEWSRWGNTGPCQTPCGTGTQRQDRTCHKTLTDSERKIRNRYCLGGRGNFTQTQTVTCKKRNCPTTPDSATTQPPTTIETTTEHSTKSSILTKLISSTEKNLNEDVRKPEELDQPSTLDTPALAAILGSVALICVAVIVVACIVVRRRRAAKPKISSSIISNSSFASRKPNDELNEYEVVAPALPYRQTILGNESPRLSSANLIRNHNADMSLRSSREINLRSSRNSSAGVYLEPLPSPTTRSLAGVETIDNNDTTYMSIDEYRK